MKKLYFASLFAILLLAACTTYYSMPVPMFNEQIKSADRLTIYLKVSDLNPRDLKAKMSPMNHTNGVEKIICYNSKGKKVSIPVKRDTKLIAIDTAGRSIELYYHTITFNNNKIRGLVSRDSYKMDSMDIKVIKQVQIKSGFVSETPLD